MALKAPCGLFSELLSTSPCFLLSHHTDFLAMPSARGACSYLSFPSAWKTLPPGNPCLSLLLPQWGLLWSLTLYEIILSLFSLTLFHKFLKHLYCICIYFLPPLLECKVCKVRDLSFCSLWCFCFQNRLWHKIHTLCISIDCLGSEWMNEGKQTYSFSS